jgi:hypothetical protein
MPAHQFPTPWDRFVKDEPPVFYVATRYRWRWREEDAFWRAAEQAIRAFRDRAQQLAHHRLAVGIGVGVGRLAVPLGKQFLRVKVIDPSLVTAVRLRDTCQRFGVCNVEPIRDSESWEEEPADLICSTLFFPHIHELATIEQYVTKIARCLNGIAFLHFDTTPKTRMEKFAERLPIRRSQGLSRHPEKRSQYDAQALRTMFAQHGFRVEDEANPRSPHHVFVLSK